MRKSILVILICRTFDADEIFFDDDFQFAEIADVLRFV